MTPLAREGQTAQIPIATRGHLADVTRDRFRGNGWQEIRDAVNEHFANLEQRFGPLHACRVVINLRFLQIFFGSTMLTKPSTAKEAAQTGDATEGLNTTVNPSRPPPQK